MRAKLIIWVVILLFVSSLMADAGLPIPGPRKPRQSHRDVYFTIIRGLDQFPGLVFYNLSYSGIDASFSLVQAESDSLVFSRKADDAHRRYLLWRTQAERFDLDSLSQYSDELNAMMTKGTAELIPVELPVCQGFAEVRQYARLIKAAGDIPKLEMGERVYSLRDLTITAKADFGKIPAFIAKRLERYEWKPRLLMESDEKALLQFLKDDPNHTITREGGPSNSKPGGLNSLKERWQELSLRYPGALMIIFWLLLLILPPVLKTLVMKLIAHPLLHKDRQPANRFWIMVPIAALVQFVLLLVMAPLVLTGWGIILIIPVALVADYLAFRKRLDLSAWQLTLASLLSGLAVLTLWGIMIYFSY